MSTTNDGGPAWPCQQYDLAGSESRVHPGMSLRDWFAGQALVGIYASSKWMQAILDATKSAEEFDKTVASHAFDVADAMLAHRHRSTFTPTNDTPREKKLP